jgi:hypothetical protein
MFSGNGVAATSARIGRVTAFDVGAERHREHACDLRDGGSQHARRKQVAVRVAA